MTGMNLRGFHRTRMARRADASAPPSVLGLHHIGPESVHTLRRNIDLWIWPVGTAVPGTSNELAAKKCQLCPAMVQHPGYQDCDPYPSLCLDP